MKKGFGLIVLGLLALLAVGLVAGCSRTSSAGAGQQTGATAQQTAEAQKWRIAFLAKGNMDVFVKNISDAALRRGQELSDKCTVTVFDAEGDMNKQIQQAEDAITQRFDAIVLIAVDYDGSAPIIDMAEEAGIVLVGDNTTTNNISKVTYVGSDDVDAGKIQGEYLKTRLQPGARVCYMMGPIGVSPQIFRKQGIEESLFNDASMNIQVLEEQTANWRRDTAMSLAEDWLTKYNNDIDAIICQNDDMAMGALEAAEAKGVKDQVIIVGVDAIADALKAIEAGRLDATVFQDAAGQGAGGVDAAIKLLEIGQKKMDDVWIPFKAVTKDNVTQFM
ncbi:MAG: substrate-binding domain-containing protein [Treponema sp.]|jgi:ABC-type sugar transport system substrate-binding protein|nr:substrate-binding domain-containing protein [Treponema sp.]